MKQFDIEVTPQTELMLFMMKEMGLEFEEERWWQPERKFTGNAIKMVTIKVKGDKQ